MTGEKYRNKNASGLERRRFFGLESRLALWFTVFALLPLCLSVFSSHMFFNAGIQDRLERLMQDVASVVKYDVENYFEEMDKALQSLSERRVTCETVLGLKKSNSKKAEQQKNEVGDFEKIITEEFETIVISQHFNTDSYRDVFLIDTDGVVLYSRNGGIAAGTDVSGKTHYETLFSESLKTSMDSGRVVFSDYEYAFQNGEYIPVAHMIRPVSCRNGDVIGYIALRVDGSGLNRITGLHNSLGQSFNIYICGTDGRLRTDKGRHSVQKALSQWEFSMDMLDAGGGYTTKDSSVLNRHVFDDGTVALWVSLPFSVKGVSFMIVTESGVDDPYSMKNHIWSLYYFPMAILALAMTGFAVASARKFIRPVTALAGWTEKVAMGDLAIVDIECKDDETGQLVQNFTHVVEFLRGTARLAMEIASGDYTTGIVLKSEKDELGYSLSKMTESLQETAKAMEALASGDFQAHMKVKGPNDLLARSLNEMVEKLREAHEHSIIQANRKTLQADLNEILRGDRQLDDLSHQVLSFFCFCFNASVGAFYVRDGEGDVLRLYSGFALPADGSTPLAILPGEGLAGQVMKEKQKIVLSDCPESFPGTQALIAEVKLTSVMAFPFMRTGQVEAVMEIGTVGRFSDMDLGFLDLVSESVAITVFSAVSRMKMEILLAKTVEQADDLRHKQQELNLTNMHLKEHTEKLQMSENQLRAKEEELINTNRALEERSVFLEQQKNAVREKNIALEKIQTELIEKTKILEDVSRYKTEFLASMSHELRTPLNSILLISRLIAENRQGNLSARQIEYAETVHMAGQDLLNIIDDILDLSRIEAGKLELLPVRIQLSDIERKIVLSFEDVCREKGIKLITMIKKGTPVTVFVDTKRLEQVIKNLVSNAVKFTVSGYIKIVYSVPEKYPDGLFIDGKSSESLMVEVKDTGTGIPENKQDIIFEAFSQADVSVEKKYGGTGLGLAISREFVRLMGGEIMLDSTVGTGSTFTFIIPGVFIKSAEEGEIACAKQIFADEKLSVKKNVVPHESRDAANEFVDRKILIVDMDMRNVYALIHCFENTGMSVLVGRNGEQAVEILEREKDVDLVIMDVLMPGMDGLDTMKKIRTHGHLKNVPVIALTARAMNSDQEKCIEAGVDAYLTKPVDLDDLTSVMKGLFEKQLELNKEN